MSDKVVSIGRKKKTEKVKQEQKIQDNRVYCSFCGRPNTEVLKMVKGPGVNICSECTLIAVQFLILQDGGLSEQAQKVIDLLWNTNNDWFKNRTPLKNNFFNLRV